MAVRVSWQLVGVGSAKKLGIYGATVAIERLIASDVLVRAKEVAQAGVPTAWLNPYVYQRAELGVYGARNTVDSASMRLLALHRRLGERALFGGLTALWLRGLYVEEPMHHWLVLGPKAHRPERAVVPFHVIRSRHHHEDVEAVLFRGEAVRVHSIARALVDCCRNEKYAAPEVTAALMARALASGLGADKVWAVAERVRAVAAVRRFLRRAPEAATSALASP